MIVLFALVSVEYASGQQNCKAVVRAAQQTCSSQMVIREGAQLQKAIEADFAPMNGRMSPESCQGFRNANQRFIEFAKRYIGNCKSAMQTAAAICRPAKGVKDVNELIENAQAYQTATKSLPVLEHYLQPNAQMSGLLNDCLKLAPGTLESANKDRGNADTSGRFSASQSTKDGLSQNQNSQVGNLGGAKKPRSFVDPFDESRRLALARAQRGPGHQLGHQSDTLDLRGRKNRSGPRRSKRGLTNANSARPEEEILRASTGRGSRLGAGDRRAHV